jgi:hypothetical protein
LPFSILIFRSKFSFGSKEINAAQWHILIFRKQF